MVNVTSDFVLQVLGAKEVELAALRIQYAQLESAHNALQAAQQTVLPTEPPSDSPPTTS